MDDAQRKHIKKNIDKLISLTDYGKLINGCVATDLITYVMRVEIENVPEATSKGHGAGGGGDRDLQYERHKRLFHKITHRGPRAYQHLKTLLSNLNYMAAVQLLNQPRNDESQFLSMHGTKRDLNQELRNNHMNTYVEHKIKDEPISLDEFKLKPFEEVITPDDKYIVKKSQHLHIDMKVGVYNMKTQHNRGIFLMVNIIDFPNESERRNGAEKDGESLLYLFRELGFKLFPYKNLTKDEFFEHLDAIIDSDFALQTECFFMALMTHGSNDGISDRVQFHDGAIVKVDDILQRFQNFQCTNLVHKPKIFIFPFCRGEIADVGYGAVQTDGFSENKNFAMSDICICYASQRGFKAHRDSTDGSWYIQVFCRLMAEHAHDSDFEDIVKLVQREAAKLRTMDGAMQMGTHCNIGLNKKLYLNPGVYDNGRNY